MVPLMGTGNTVGEGEEKTMSLEPLGPEQPWGHRVQLSRGSWIQTVAQQDTAAGSASASCSTRGTGGGRTERVWC